MSNDATSDTPWYQQGWVIALFVIGSILFVSGVAAEIAVIVIAVKNNQIPGITYQSEHVQIRTFCNLIQAKNKENNLKPYQRNVMPLVLSKNYFMAAKSIMHNCYPELQ